MAVDGIPAAAAAAVDGTAPPASALGDNLAKKGNHAYYYAHAHRATGPKWDGRIEPRLLSGAAPGAGPRPAPAPAADARGPVVAGGGASESAAASPGVSRSALLERSNITSYAFLDEVAKVKIYVELPGVGRCRAEDVALDFTERSLCLTVRNYAPPVAARAGAGKLVADTAPVAEEGGGEGEGEVRRLSFGRLYGRIEAATCRTKPDKVVVTLKKKDGDKRAWMSVIA